MSQSTSEQATEISRAEVTCPKCKCWMTHTVKLLGQTFYRCFMCGHTFDDDELQGSK